MASFFRYRDERIAIGIVERLKRLLSGHLRFMHVCGTHQDTIVRFGLDIMLKEAGIEVIPGPGCPVCVTTPYEIEIAVNLANNGKIIATFGDMFRVKGVKSSLADARASGASVFIVYSVSDAIAIASEHKKKDVVFFSIGFETTAPATASAVLNGVPENFSILSAHRLIPPAMSALIEMGEMRIDGFINPGHVSSIIGVGAYEHISKRYGVPQVIAGFEPIDVMYAVYMLVSQIMRGEACVENEYRRVVRYDGNKKAREVMNAVFRAVDVAWRGFPVIKSSGLQLKRTYEDNDALKRYEDEIDEIEQNLTELMEKQSSEATCRCGDVLRGIISPAECPLFGRACSPHRPIGPCMVSREGSCNILYRYRKSSRL